MTLFESRKCSQRTVLGLEEEGAPQQLLARAVVADLHAQFCAGRWRRARACFPLLRTLKVLWLPLKGARVL